MKKHTYLQAKEKIFLLLINGEITKNDNVFSERKIAEMLKYSRSTIRRAIKSLIEDGILYRTNHYNSNLKFKELDHNQLEVGDNSSNSITQDIKIKGMFLKNDIISFKLVYEKISDKFVEDDIFYELVRVRSTKEESFSLQKAYIPFRLFEDAHRYNFESLSLYSYMEFRGNKPVFFKRKLQFINANSELEKYLEINKNTKIYFFEYYGYNKNKLLVEYTQSYFTKDSIKINLKIENK